MHILTSMEVCNVQHIGMTKFGIMQYGIMQQFFRTLGLKSIIPENPA